MTLITPEIDVNIKALKDGYLAAKARLEEIETQMQTSPTPTLAYAAIKDLADINGKLLVVLKNMLT